jgi:hypothetical protein
MPTIVGTDPPSGKMEIDQKFAALFPPSLPEPTRIPNPQKPSLPGSDVLYIIFSPLIDGIENGTTDR